MAFCEAVYEKTASVEGLTAVHADSLEEAMDMVNPSRPVVLVDSEGDSIREIKPDVVVDAILAKRNLGTRRDMAKLTIGLGPGFSAGKDVDYVIETMRGHNLGRVIEEGPAMADTGVPGRIMGYGKERVIHAPGRRNPVRADRDCRTGKKGRCHCRDQRRRRHRGVCIRIS